MTSSTNGRNTIMRRNTLLSSKRREKYIYFIVESNSRVEKVKSFLIGFPQFHAHFIQKRNGTISNKKLQIIATTRRKRSEFSHLIWIRHNMRVGLVFVNHLKLKFLLFTQVMRLHHVVLRFSFTNYNLKRNNFIPCAFLLTFQPIHTPHSLSSIVPLFHCSIVPLFHCSIVLFFIFSFSYSPDHFFRDFSASPTIPSFRSPFPLQFFHHSKYVKMMQYYRTDRKKLITKKGNEEDIKT
eukprot:TRINITY_DN374_c0_g1_i1.p1 TRINITY_DN374_c0_g1~~TRINITY_DN374_c0_g1_i1.p1  ORF type:complete len:238 (+),score=14.23 TRINITY_DN374_c0_g1_i1:305-1018(+)